jgi:hypothetical protein
MHEVSGVITLDGQPVENAIVLFTPEGEGFAASGTTDAQGRYQLNTMEKPGATEGPHRVTITKIRTVGTNRAPEESDYAVGVKTEYLVPKKYASSETSELKAEVGSQEKYDFELTSN